MLSHASLIQGTFLKQFIAVDFICDLFLFLPRHFPARFIHVRLNHSNFSPDECVFLACPAKGFTVNNRQEVHIMNKMKMRSIVFLIERKKKAIDTALIKLQLLNEIRFK